jgi:hypothetical protein
LDLVAAAIQRQDDLRLASEKVNDIRVSATAELQSTKIEALSVIQNWMRDTEMKRIQEKDNQRQFYETRIADMLRTSVESTSTLVSTQLVQIQNTFNERVAKLEQFRWESGGKTSVSDPALAEALSRQALASERMVAAIADLQTTRASGAGNIQGHSEFQTVHRATIGSIVGIVLAAVGIVSLLLAGYVQVNHGQSPATVAAAPNSSGR